MKKLVILLAALLFTQTVFSQVEPVYLIEKGELIESENLVMKRLEQQPGESIYEPQHVTQDNRGFIFLADQNNIVLHDGQSFLSYSDIGIAKISGMVPYENSVLLSNGSDTVFRFTYGKTSPFAVLPEKIIGLSTTGRNVILYGEESSYVTNPIYGYEKLNAFNGAKTLGQVQLDSTVYNYTNSEIIHIDNTDTTLLASGLKGINQVVALGDGLMVSSSFGLSYLEKEGTKPKVVFSGRADRLVTTDRSAFFIAGDQVYIWSKSFNQVKQIDLPSKAKPINLLADAENVWIVCTNHLLYHISETEVRTYRVDEGEAYADILQVKNSDQLLVSTTSGKLKQLDYGELTPIVLSNSGRINTAIKYKNNYLIGGSNGLYLSDGSGKVEFSSIDREVLSIAVYKDKIWVGTTNGLYILDDHSDSNPGMLYNGHDIFDLAIYKEELAIATDHGIYLTNTENTKHFTLTDGVPGSSIHSLSIDPQGRLLIAGHSGLSIYDGESLTSISSLRGIPVYQVWPSDSSWLIHTNSFIQSFDPKNNEVRALVNNILGDDLLDVEIVGTNFWVLSSETLYRYPLKNLSGSTESIGLLTTNLNGKTLPINSYPNLNFGDERRLRFDFYHPSYNPIADQKHQFYYRMAGHDSTLRLLGDETIEYYNLPSGRYRFQVGKVVNSRFEPTSEQAFYVQRPFYVHPLFFSLLFLVGLFGFVKAVRSEGLKAEEKNDELMKVVFDHSNQIESQSNLIKYQKQEMEGLYNKLSDSVKYASRIQNSILPGKDLDERSKGRLKSFIILHPKDIVSGDLYWYHWVNDRELLVAAIDCTGHGVSGAFLTIIAKLLLDSIVMLEHIKNPCAILHKLDIDFKDLVANSDSSISINDGMDMALVNISFDKKQITFSGAGRPLYMVRNGNLSEYKGARAPIGGSKAYKVKKFQNEVIPIQNGDTFYLSSDGYADQFDYTNSRKLYAKNFKLLLEGASKQPVESQLEFLDTYYQNWKGDTRQFDDVLVIGLKVDNL